MKQPKSISFLTAFVINQSQLIRPRFSSIESISLSYALNETPESEGTKP